MAIIYREGLGRELSFTEMDNNFKEAEAGVFSQAALAHAGITVTQARDQVVGNGYEIVKMLNDGTDNLKTFLFKGSLASDTGVAEFAYLVWQEDNAGSKSWTYAAINNTGGGGISNYTEAIDFFIGFQKAGPSHDYGAIVVTYFGTGTCKGSWDIYQGLGNLVSVGGQ